MFPHQNLSYVKANNREQHNAFLKFYQKEHSINFLNKHQTIASNIISRESKHTFAKTMCDAIHICQNFYWKNEHCVHDDEHSGHEENDAIQFNTLILSIYLVLYVASIG